MSVSISYQDDGSMLIYNPTIYSNVVSGKGLIGPVYIFNVDFTLTCKHCNNQIVNPLTDFCFVMCNDCDTQLESENMGIVCDPSICQLPTNEFVSL